MAIGRLLKLTAPRQVIIYFLCYFLTAALSVITITLLTHYLTPADYGIINLYSSFIALLTPFVTCGVLSPVFVQFYKRTPEEYRHFFTNAQALTLVSLAFFTLVFILFRQQISHLLHVTSIWVIVLPFTVWWMMGVELGQMMCRIKNKPWGFAFFTVGKNGVEVLLTVVFVIGLGLAWPGRLLSGALTPIILGLIGIYLFRNWKLYSRTIEWKKIGNIAWISVPFVFERLSIFVLNNSDRYFIDKYDLGGTNQVGLYSVGAQIATIIYLVILSMNSAYQPYLFHNLSTGNMSKVKRGTGLYILASAVIVGGIFLTTPLIFHLFINKRFHDGMIFTYYLTAGNFMWAVYNAFIAFLLFHSKNRLILYIAVAGMVISISLNFIMVPRYGAYGAAITSIITYTFMAAASAKFSWKYLKA